MLEAHEAKMIVLDLGADLCGIAPADRFTDAPAGFYPRDVYEDCESVLVFAKRLPIGPLFASSAVPYTRVNNLLKDELDRIGYAASLELEKAG